MASWTEETSRPVGSSSRIPPTTTIAGAIWIPTGLPNRHSSSAMKVTRKEQDAVMKKSGVRQRPSFRASRLTSRLETKATAEAPGPAAEHADEDGGEHRERDRDHPARERLGAADDLVQPADGLLAADAAGHDVGDQLVDLGQARVVVGPGPHHPQQRDGRLVLGRVVDAHRLVGDVHLDVLQAQGRGDRR